MDKRIHIIVRGIVQGVGFRSFIARRARMLGLRGFVRNLPDGYSVEIVAEGDENALRTLLEYAKEGPPGAVVENVEFEFEDAKGEFRDFRIVY